MVERSFKKEIELLGLGTGEEFRGEAIVAITKALLESGVSYIGGYPGSPISTLLDVCGQAFELLGELGVRFETSGNEASAAAMLGASVQYPLRGAVTWKATVGTNVAADPLASLASSGVTGGALIILGEDYGQGASALQERSYGFAMKSQIWLLDPRPNLPSIVKAVKMGFELSEASNTPVMLQMRIRACHAYGHFMAEDNKKPAFSPKEVLENPKRDLLKVTVPPIVFEQEKRKQKRLSDAIAFIEEKQINEFFEGDVDTLGIIVQGGHYNSTLRALERSGYADAFGNSRIPLYVMNVAYPVSENEISKFCKGKEKVFIIEEGQPSYVEPRIAQILRNNRIFAEIIGKTVLPLSEYTAGVIYEGIKSFLEISGQDISPHSGADKTVKQAGEPAPPRPPTFCTGCPERPIFTAMKLVEKDLGKFHVGADIGCHGLAIFEPFNMGSTLLGYGQSVASVSALADGEGNRPLTVLGDGGFWHSGLTTGVLNAVQNKDDQVLVIVDNDYIAATGGQLSPSSRNRGEGDAKRLSIQNVLKSVGVDWIKTVDSFNIRKMSTELKEAMTTKVGGLKVIVAEGECQLNKKRRTQPEKAIALQKGRRFLSEKFGVDENLCTGDHSCIRLSGCPSLTIKPNPDPLRTDPVAHVNNDCVGCGVCGEVSHAAVLCPSFYKIVEIRNPCLFDKIIDPLRATYIGLLNIRLSKSDPVGGTMDEVSR